MAEFTSSPRSRVSAAAPMVADGNFYGNMTRPNAPPPAPPDAVYGNVPRPTNAPPPPPTKKPNQPPPPPPQPVYSNQEQDEQALYEEVDEVHKKPPVVKKVTPPVTTPRINKRDTIRLDDDESLTEHGVAVAVAITNATHIAKPSFAIPVPPPPPAGGIPPPPPKIAPPVGAPAMGAGSSLLDAIRNKQLRSAALRGDTKKVDGGVAAILRRRMAVEVSDESGAESEPDSEWEAAAESGDDN